MSIWGVFVVVGVLIIAGLVVARRGKVDREARRQLRQLRRDEKRVLNESAAVERRLNTLWLSHLPGKHPPPGTY